MFLKVMHDGADEFLDQAQSDATHSIYSDVTDCSFRRFSPPEGIGNDRVFGSAHIRRRQAAGPETELHISLTGDAFLMNDQGRTISKFRAAGYKDAIDQQEPNDLEVTSRLLREMPYWGAALIRQAVEEAHRWKGIGGEILDILNRDRVAVDASDKHASTPPVR